ncbi:flagellar basal body P-ring formation chaperone FlgA [Solimicrobium silvestre]|uniref:Flagella basal body P-ring formation protein FlgA n=1 Tax=Solimicrobium silvestre TaxID=2099400 RepID=A0A2S9GVU8_9BURK|nr:flagellar basal body P-ring formation chaperone FlgA [Solimicrobium silvestre]PRC91831.1 Flagella basal body P-ring formation protein FlgA [Solimicrobium silvestre]
MKPAVITMLGSIHLLLQVGLGLTTLACVPLHAAEDKQNLQEIRETVKQYLNKESAGISSTSTGTNTVTTEVGAIDSRLNLAPCAALEAFMPGGSHLWGKTTVGVRCLAPQLWVIYVPGVVKIWGNYYVAAKSIAQGQTITEADISTVKGDLTTLASGIVTEPSQALGHTSTMSLAAGIPLRQDGLHLQQVVLQGQTIRLISSGAGFNVSTEAQALNSASEGQLVKVKINSGQVLSGIAKSGGIVEVRN